jgi:hypothetical protein
VLEAVQAAGSPTTIQKFVSNLLDDELSNATKKRSNKDFILPLKSRQIIASQRTMEELMRERAAACNDNRMIHHHDDDDGGNTAA